MIISKDTIDDNDGDNDYDYNMKMIKIITNDITEDTDNNNETAIVKLWSTTVITGHE